MLILKIWLMIHVPVAILWAWCMLNMDYGCHDAGMSQLSPTWKTHVLHITFDLGTAILWPIALGVVGVVSYLERKPAG